MNDSQTVVGLRFYFHPGGSVIRYMPHLKAVDIIGKWMKGYYRMDATRRFIGDNADPRGGWGVDTEAIAFIDIVPFVEPQQIPTQAQPMFSGRNQ